MIDISIIVVCYRGWDRLTRCLDSINRLKSGKFSYEVIVVDNNSCEETIYDLEKKFSAFKFIHNKVNGGYANGNNLGSSHAKGEFILVLNPDTEASETEVEKLLISARSHPEYSIISCRQINENGKETASTGEFPRFGNLTGFQRTVSQLFKSGGTKSKDIKGESVISPDWISGSVVWMRRDLYQSLNGFFEGFWMYYEDVDICKRVSKAGGKIIHLNNITIEHNHGGSSRINLKTASVTKTEVHISRHLYIARNMKGFERLIIQAFLVVNNLISGAVMASAGILLFFIPKIFLRTMIFFRLLEYYVRAFIRNSWISPRSVLYNSPEC
jgi:GT2 family glycosyltransferase